jgi:acyl-CoA synthetase (AMP-forming)/AMP-acid ligase II
VVVFKSGQSAGEQELIEHCRQRLAGYKCPKYIEFWEEIPKTAVGKILRREVKKHFWQGRDKMIS